MDAPSPHERFLPTVAMRQCVDDIRADLQRARGQGRDITPANLERLLERRWWDILQRHGVTDSALFDAGRGLSEQIR